MANCVIAYNPCFSCDKKKCEICELDMHRKRVFQQSEGEWIDADPNGHLYRFTCSLCGKTKLCKRTPFCPNCGAKMKGGAEQREVVTDTNVSHKKYFTPEDVRKMTREEVGANYSAILDSMKKWE